MDVSIRVMQICVTLWRTPVLGPTCEQVAVHASIASLLKPGLRQIAKEILKDLSVSEGLLVCNFLWLCQ